MIDLSDLQGGGGKKPAKKKQDKPLLSNVSADTVDMFCQGNGVKKEGEALKAGPEAEIKEAYIHDLFHRNAGLAEAAKTFQARGSAPQDSVTVYHNAAWAKVVLQDGTEIDPKGEAKLRALQDITDKKFDKCFEEHVEIKMDTSQVAKGQRDEFIMDMIAVLNKYKQAHTLRKILKFTPGFEASRYEILNPSQNLQVQQHMPLSIICK
tara:strand:- start:37176 stop:37799 length:624 start_codon:yes stop_codon:yes gene_type:complete